MAKRINFTNNQGVTFPDSYWRVASVNYSAIEKTIFVSVIAHKDSQARQDGLEPVAKRSFVVTDSEEFDALASSVINKNKNILEIGYQILNREKFFSDGEDI
jgi:hypothetical protein